MMSAEVIAIGDELTSGVRLDTNSQWLAQQLLLLGVPVACHTTVGDQQPAIVAALAEACHRADIVVVSGGLGPTADDLTRQALAQLVGQPLVLDEGMLSQIRQLFVRRGRPMPERNVSQAQFPAGSQPLANAHGTAPGIRVRVARGAGGSSDVFALPGVPAELREMWAAHVAPAILELLGPARPIIVQRQLRCFGAGESEIEQRLPDLIQRGRDPTVGITASAATITLRITARGESAEACRAKIEPTVATIRECLGTLVYGEGNDELQDAVSCLLAERGATLATAEWGTAGLVASMLGEVPGSALYYRGGVVVRDYAALARLLDVTVNTSRGQAADAPSLAARMAVAVCDRCEADYGLAVGPIPRIDPATTPPPQVHVAVAQRGRVQLEPFAYAAHPAVARTRCAKQAMNVLRLTLLNQRRGALSLPTLMVLSAVMLALLMGFLAWDVRRPSARGVEPLLVFCAAGLRYPMEQIVAHYQREFGVATTVQYGGSNTLLSQVAVSRVGDLFLAADDTFVRRGQELGLMAEVIPLATMYPVIAIRRDGPRRVADLSDLLQPDVRVACANPDATAIGDTTRRLLQRSGAWESLEAHIQRAGVFKPTVNDVANDVKLGSVDAGIIWDTTAAAYPELAAVRVPELDGEPARVEIAVLASARRPATALHFARYVSARDRGLQTFAAHHFTVVDGDRWADVPEITLFAGAVNRRALEPILDRFQEREGIVINTVYNGCGILTAQMRIAAEKQGLGFPDTYMACDVYYLDTVKDWFQEAVNVSDTDIVIAVQKGNPKSIQSLTDLLRPGVRVAIGQPEQCTIGALTRRLLEHEGIYDQLLDEHVVTQTETSALLVPAVTTRAADAALAYRTDTLAERDKIDVVAIDSPLATAIQPFSIARSSDHKELGRRLFRAISQSRQAFEAAGFHWRLAD